MLIQNLLKRNARQKKQRNNEQRAEKGGASQSPQKRKKTGGINVHRATYAFPHPKMLTQPPSTKHKKISQKKAGREQRHFTGRDSRPLRQGAEMRSGRCNTLPKSTYPPLPQHTPRRVLDHEGREF